MKTKIVLCLVLGIFLICGVGMYYSSYQESQELSVEEEINIAIASYELSSYGWKTQRDKDLATANLQIYINSKVKEMEQPI